MVVGALSYGDGVRIGISVDRDVVDDVDVLIDGMRLAADELLDASRAAIIGAAAPVDPSPGDAGP